LAESDLVIIKNSMQVPNAEQRPLSISEHLGMSKNKNDSFGF
jgi:hypothetical protein